MKLSEEDLLIESSNKLDNAAFFFRLGPEISIGFIKRTSCQYNNTG
jgi:hypothetical protein